LHLNRLNILGTLMIIIGILLFFMDFLDKMMLILTYPFLEGSSEGKAVLFFLIMGSMLLIYPLFRFDGKIMKKMMTISPTFKVGELKYLKMTILMIFFIYIIGIIIEIWIRVKLGVSIFTIFVSLDPAFSTTSVTHSHILKSLLGSFINYIGIYIPSHIHTGISLAQYVPFFTFIIFILFPLIYIAGMISLNNQRDLYKLIIIFALTISFIGMLDGGLFSAPALVGFSGLLGIYAIKTPFSPRQLIKPSLIIAVLIILRVYIGLIGTQPDFHEITIIEPTENIELNGHNVLTMKNEGSKTIIKISKKTTDKNLIEEMIHTLNDKCSGFFISWNIYSSF